MIQFVCIGLGILLTVGCGSEKAKWQHAQAINIYEEGDLAGAIELLEKAYEQAPNNEDIQLDLARFYAEDGQCELGIGLCRNYLENRKDDVRGLNTRSRCRMCSGKFKAALRDYKTSISGHVSRSTGELNNLAYYRGLAGVELEQAARDIQKAITELELHQGWGSGGRLSRVLSLQVRTVIAAGLVSRHIESQNEAIKFLDRMIESYESEMNSRLGLLKTRIAFEARTESPFSTQVEKVLVNDRFRIELFKTSIAAMITTRALIHEDLEECEQADRDRLRVKALGYDFQGLVDDLPLDFSCLDSLSMAATYLDTRGFVSGRQKWNRDENDQLGIVLRGDSKSRCESSYQESLEDMDLAVLAAQFQQLAMDSELVNTPDLSPMQIKKLKAETTKTTAVLLHHRREVHLRGGNLCEAEKDELKIEKLGFKDSTLY